MMIIKNTRLYPALILLTVFLLYPFSHIAQAAPEVKKEQLAGKIWYVKKNFYILKADGTYERQLRLRKRKIITSCSGKYTITGNKVEFEGFCPNSRDKFHWVVLSIEPDKIKIVNIAFGPQLPEEGVRAEKVLKRFEGK